MSGPRPSETKVTRGKLAAIGLGAGLCALAVVVVVALGRGRGPEPSCGPGFFARDSRCCVSASGPCGRAETCPKPLVRDPERGACAAPSSRVKIPETTVIVGPSDWEAEGRVATRTVHTAAFFVDAFEAQVGDVASADDVRQKHLEGDLARAASGISFAEARAYCTRRGGRIPREDEWLVAAAGSKPRRYPWGDTGAVCRRAAWGLAEGPCGRGATGPDTVGAHPDGDTELGLHDMAGNVAEWVEAQDGHGKLRGGSYTTSLATDLRTWASRDPSPEAQPEAGVRCVYDP